MHVSYRISMVSPIESSMLGANSRGQTTKTSEFLPWHPPVWNLESTGSNGSNKVTPVEYSTTDVEVKDVTKEVGDRFAWRLLEQ